MNRAVRWNLQQMRCPLWIVATERPGMSCQSACALRTRDHPAGLLPPEFAIMSRPCWTERCEDDRATVINVMQSNSVCTTCIKEVHYYIVYLCAVSKAGTSQRSAQLHGCQPAIGG
jgi:hypothetical protein